MVTQNTKCILYALIDSNALKALDGNASKLIEITCLIKSYVHATRIAHLLFQSELVFLIVHRHGVPNRAMSDFVAPRETGLR